MSERHEQELDLLRTVYPGLQWRPDTHWIRIPGYLVPAGSWAEDAVDVACRLPPSVGEQPYAFFVHSGLTAVGGGQISNYTFPVPTCFEGEWGQFSWAPEMWTPHIEITRGSNMLNFVRSFADRLREGP